MTLHRNLHWIIWVRNRNVFLLFWFMWNMPLNLNFLTLNSIPLTYLSIRRLVFTKLILPFLKPTITVGGSKHNYLPIQSCFEWVCSRFWMTALYSLFILDKVLWNNYKKSSIIYFMNSRPINSDTLDLSRRTIPHFLHIV